MWYPRIALISSSGMVAHTSRTAVNASSIGGHTVLSACSASDRIANPSGSYHWNRYRKTEWSPVACSTSTTLRPRPPFSQMHRYPFTVVPSPANRRGAHTPRKRPTPQRWLRLAQNSSSSSPPFCASEEDDRENAHDQSDRADVRLRHEEAKGRPPGTKRQRRQHAQRRSPLRGIESNGPG